MNKVDVVLPEFDLNPIKFKLIYSDEGPSWSLDFCNLLEKEYRRFLALSKFYPSKTIVPSKIIDEFWHAHILDTRKYAQDCEDYFGNFLHHFPYLGMRSEEDAEILKTVWSETKEIYQLVFNEPMPELAKSSHADCANCFSSCGGNCGNEGIEGQESAVAGAIKPNWRPTLA